MIFEHAVINVAPGKEDEFEEAFPSAREVMEKSPGCLSVRLFRCVELPERFLLFVEWENVEAHMEGFRKSDAFARWREIVGPYFAYLSDMEHFRPVAEG
ncbi:MAG: antibiotic biosynthesis monooxygenase family protein [Acidimicrobiales bacterium]